jgi:hypothetical protein
MSGNIRRRHLNTAQKRELIIKIIAAAPEKSDCQIAKSIGVDHKTIGTARAKGEQLGSIPQLKKTIGADGKARPRGPRARRQLRLEQRKARPSSAHCEDDGVMHVRTPGACPVPRRVRFEVAPDGDIPTREEAEESYQRTLRDLGEPYDHQSPWAARGASAPDADEPEGEGDSEEVCWRRGLLYRATNAAGEAIYEDWSQFEVDSKLVAAAERAAAAWGKTAAYLRELRQARLRSDTADPLDDIPGFLDRTRAAS